MVRRSKTAALIFRRCICRVSMLYLHIVLYCCKRRGEKPPIGSTGAFSSYLLGVQDTGYTECGVCGQDSRVQLHREHNQYFFEERDSSEESQEGSESICDKHLGQDVGPGSSFDITLTGQSMVTCPIDNHPTR